MGEMQKEGEGAGREDVVRRTAPSLPRSIEGARDVFENVHDAGGSTGDCCGEGFERRDVGSAIEPDTPFVCFFYVTELATSSW